MSLNSRQELGSGLFAWHEDSQGIKHGLELFWLINWVNLVESVRTDPSQVHVFCHLILWSQRFWIVEPKLVGLSVRVNVVKVRGLEVASSSDFSCNVIGSFVGQDLHDVLVSDLRSSCIGTVYASERNEGEITSFSLVVSSIFTWVVVAVPRDSHDQFLWLNSNTEVILDSFLIDRERTVC